MYSINIRNNWLSELGTRHICCDTASPGDKFVPCHDTAKFGGEAIMLKIVPFPALLIDKNIKINAWAEQAIHEASSTSDNVFGHS